MKVGNACHKDYSHIMGNSQNIGTQDCRVVVGSRHVVIPAAWITRSGRYRKRYEKAIQGMITGLRKENIAA